jgi:hypothetical protein
MVSEIRPPQSGAATRLATSDPTPVSTITGMSPTMFMPTVMTSGLTLRVADSTAMSIRSATEWMRPSLGQFS